MKALTASGRAGDAAFMLDRAQSTTVDDQISKMFLALYRQPSGYQDALTIADSLSNDRAATGRADYWFYRAAAFGQKYSALLRQSPRPQAELDATKQSVLDAARQAIGLDVGYRVRLNGLAHPAVGSQDNDLVGFADDQEFNQVVGQPST